MIGRDVIAVYGRADLIIAAFVLVAGIIAAPVLEKLASPVVALSTGGAKLGQWRAFCAMAGALTT